MHIMKQFATFSLSASTDSLKNDTPKHIMPPAPFQRLRGIAGLFRVSEQDCINDIQMFFGIKSTDDELCSRRDRFLSSLVNSTNTVISFFCPFRSMSSFHCNFFCVVFVYSALLLLSVIDEKRFILVCFLITA